ncbi:8-oxoguanine deaminase [Candidatus Sumerlaeota bacterium]|nr:8-oxoguanine deaminase [Candidatus Sumerlaeota bacterium]
MLLIENCRAIACMDDKRTELSNADILIDGPAIVAVGPKLRDARQLPPDIPTIDGRGHVALPGFVNVHHHFFQTLSRTCPRVQNAELFEWLVEQYQIWEIMDPEFFYVSAKVAMAELLLTGCTTTSDHHYLFPASQPVELLDQDIRAAREVGMRFNPTRGSMTLGVDDGGLPPMSVIEKDERVLADYERLISTYHDTSPYSMLRIALAPCAPFNVTPYLFQETVKVARKHGVKIHTHLAETDDEDAYCMQRYGKRPYDVVADQGWEGPDVWFAHCVKLNSAEIARFARHGVGVAHCPSANCRLGSGIAPIPEMLRAGVAVGLGVDGSASNDSGDILAEARLAFLIHRSRWGVHSIGTRDCLHMLTRGGAAVLGNDHIGRIEPGAAADVVLFDMEQFAFAGGPSLDPIGALILCGTSHHVAWSIINGEVVVERGRVCNLPEVPLVRRANELTGKLVDHGLSKRGLDYRQMIDWPVKTKG